MRAEHRYSSIRVSSALIFSFSSKASRELCHPIQAAKFHPRFFTVYVSVEKQHGELLRLEGQPVAMPENAKGADKISEALAWATI
jgi:hypothetical protein